MRDSKISNIAITIDKVMHVLRSMGTMDPPIRELTFKEVRSLFRELIYRNTIAYGARRTLSGTLSRKFSAK